MSGKDVSPGEMALAEALARLAGQQSPPAGSGEGESTEASQRPDGVEGPALRPAEPSAPVPRCPAMRTLLREFGEQFEADFRPLVGPIRRAAETLADVSGDWPVCSLLPDLRELAHQVQVLTDKVAEQQAYVLIFGPLKSGKSTFMNAVCSAYVSEVTSMPAYPCIVSVSHSESPGFVVTRYDGREMPIADQRSLHHLVQDAHKELMARIRRVETGGQDFDPATHMPQAYRAIHVRLPMGDLADSGAVLVDTPGLYSRMKFGYDQMTRDFRNAAACAIFIVKTDNLFLEQVFEEFHELLKLFSRVFLIVNLDATKCDLAPDGRLVPSLERQDPRRIIEAFRDLSLNAPLKAADDAGRLKIYPADLLHAASARIRKARTGQVDEQPDPPHGQANFGELLQDLTDYLNSTEYLHEFLHDSLRRAGSLLSQLDELAEHDRVRELARQASALRGAREEAVAQSEAIARLETIDWTSLAAALRRRLATAAADQAEAGRRMTVARIDDELHKWFCTDLPLQELVASSLGPLLARTRDECLSLCREEMTRQAGGAAAGLSLSPEALADLRSVEIDLAAEAREALGAMPAPEEAVPVGVVLRSDDIPVKRGFWDWVLLRSKARVRQRLFGPPQCPEQPIPPEKKAKRLGEAAEEVMRSLARERLRLVLDEAAGQLPERLVDAYASALSGSLRDLLARKEEEVRQRIAELEQELAEAERLLADIAALRDAVERARPLADALRERFVPAERPPEAQAEVTPPEAEATPAEAAEPAAASAEPPSEAVPEAEPSAAPHEAEEAAAPQADEPDEEADLHVLRPMEPPEETGGEGEPAG